MFILQGRLMPPPGEELPMAPPGPREEESMLLLTKFPDEELKGDVEVG